MEGINSTTNRIMQKTLLVAAILMAAAHLVCTSKGERQAQRYTRVTATPNPFATQFDVAFELQESCRAKLKLYDVFGKLAYSHDFGKLEAGSHTETISPNVIDGTYVLNVTVGSRTLRTIIVKKGGAQ